MSYQQSKGFALPAVIVISVTLLITFFALFQTIVSIGSLSRSQYYIQLAEEAAEAGTTYATACLELNGRLQTWGSAASGGAKPNLTQNTDCSGTNLGTTYSVVVATDSRISTDFEVSNLDFSSASASETNSVQISAQGYARVKNVASGATVKTYEATVKKTITWNSDLTSERSTSGTFRTCGLLSDNTYCWGNNGYGQLGNGTTTDSMTPVKVVRQSYPGGIGSHKITDIASGAYFNCAIIDTGEVYCWGYNNKGQLGNGTTTDSSVPVKVIGIDGKVVTQVGTANSTACAITTIGDMYCWGADAVGQLGDGGTVGGYATSPILIAGPSIASGGGDIGTKPVTSLTRSGAFNIHICAVAGGQAYCWGKNDTGQIGDNSTTNRSAPTAVNTNSGSGSQLLPSMTVTAIASEGGGGNAHSCAIAYTTSSGPTSSRVYCWGANSYGQLGTGASTSSTSLVPKAVSTAGVLSGKTITEVAANDFGSCVIGYDGVSTSTSRAYCWGHANSRGDGASSYTLVPVQVNDGNGIFLNNQISGIAGGAQRMCAIATGKSYCWGANGIGQIGNGTTINPIRTPTEALFLRPKNNQYIY